MSKVNVEELLRNAIRILKEAGGDSPRLDAELLLAHVIGKDRTAVLCLERAVLSAAQVSSFSGFVERRVKHEPMAYIRGFVEFYGFDFEVSPAVLIPRCETELLIDHALAKVGSISAAKCAAPRILDLCCGSGCITVTLAKKCVCEVIGWDNSAAALMVAKRNNKKLKAQAIFELKDVFKEENWRGVPPFDLIVSNPPYVSRVEMQALPHSVSAYEPAEALAGGEDGMDFYRRISKSGSQILADRGWLILEIGYRQGSGVLSLLANDGWINLSLHQDYSGNDRVVVAQRQELPIQL